MDGSVRAATTVAELVELVRTAETATIEVRGKIEGAPSLHLKPGQSLCGAAGACIQFEPGHDGVVVTADNSVEKLQVQVSPERCALRNDTGLTRFGRLTINQLRTVGSVRLIAGKDSTDDHVDAPDVCVVEADARAFEERPSGFGVKVVPGAFTLWNPHTSRHCRISAGLRGLSAGCAGRPVRGSGVLVGGTLDGGGMSVSVLETGEIHSDGGIAPGTPDQISGGVFILQGTDVDAVHNFGAVTTYGPNDMVLGNRGRVGFWHAHAKVTFHGPSGIGFVNLGQLGRLSMDALLETHGAGACGLNSGEVKQPSLGASVETDGLGAPARSAYAGAVQHVTFERIVTRGDGAIGIQVSVPIGRVMVKRGIETYGGVGASLARGVVTKLAAVALSLKPGGSAREMIIEGGLTTRGEGIEAIELHGLIDELRISGGAGPVGGGFTVV